MFENAIIVHFDNNANPLRGLFFWDVAAAKKRHAILHVFLTKETAASADNFISAYEHTHIHIIETAQLSEFRFPLTNAAYFPCAADTDPFIESANDFRSAYQMPATDVLIMRALEAGIWVIQSEQQLTTWQEFDEPYEDLPDSPIRDQIIYGQVESPVIKMKRPKNIFLDYGARIFARSIILNHAGSVYLGRGAHIGCDCEINVFSDFHVGDFSIISTNFRAIDFNHTLNSVATYHMGRGPFGFLGTPQHESGEIRIGSDVWIGTGVTFLGSLEIGHGAVIGAGSVVTRNVEPYSIVAGNPARLIRKRFDDDVIKYLLNLGWWAWPTKKIYQYRNFFLQEIANKSVREIEEMLHQSTQVNNP